MPIVTSTASTTKSNIISGIKIKPPTRSLTEFFAPTEPPTKKQKTTMSASSSSPQQQQDEKRDATSVTVIDTNIPVLTPIPHQRIKELTPEHVKWMQGYIDNEKYDGRWIVTEYIDGKEIVIYFDGKNITYGTPYHGFINKELVPVFEDSETLEKHVHAFYRKVKEVDQDVHTVALKLIFYGSRMNPASVYTNTDVRMMLVDVYWKYNKEQVVEYKLMTYSHLCKLLDSKGAFLDENGKGIERLCFRVPRILLSTTNGIGGAVDYIEKAFRTGFHKSDADPAIVVGGFVVKSDKDFRVVPKNNKHKHPVRVIGKRLIVPAEGYNKDVSLADLTSRLEGKVREVDKCD